MGTFLGSTCTFPATVIADKLLGKDQSEFLVVKWGSRSYIVRAKDVAIGYGNIKPEPKHVLVVFSTLEPNSV